jgi:hypothetical protein
MVPKYSSHEDCENIISCKAKRREREKVMAGLLAGTGPLAPIRLTLTAISKDTIEIAFNLDNKTATTHS